MIPSITRQEFLSYEQVRRSGVTNMWAIQIVQKRSGLSRQKLLTIMEHYAAFADRYLPAKEATEPADE